MQPRNRKRLCPHLVGTQNKQTTEKDTLHFCVELGWQVQKKSKPKSYPQISAGLNLIRINKGASNFQDEKVLLFVERYLTEIKKWAALPSGKAAHAAKNYEV
jgi:hypothetical protein